MDADEIQVILENEYYHVLTKGLDPSLVIMSPENFEKIKNKYATMLGQDVDIVPGKITYRGITVYRSIDAGDKIIVK